MFSPDATPQDIQTTPFFEEPLVPIGAEPTRSHCVALAAALRGHAARSDPDDFASLTAYLEAQPGSPWTAALLTNLGIEYYHTGQYSKALEAWRRAWALASDATDLKARALADRAVGELAYMHARLGQMAELDALLRSVEGRAFRGPATERITGAREGLSSMRTRPEVSFRCGPHALHQIKLLQGASDTATELIRTSESTAQGYALSRLAELSKELALCFQMAHRGPHGAFVVPSVVHFKLDHYAAMTRKEGDRYLLQDPTFGNDVWVTAATLEAETSGYFLVPAGDLSAGWRTGTCQRG